MSILMEGVVGLNPPWEARTKVGFRCEFGCVTRVGNVGEEVRCLYVVKNLMPWMGSMWCSHWT
jgi:hypothetical protein